MLSMRRFWLLAIFKSAEIKSEPFLAKFSNCRVENGSPCSAILEFNKFKEFSSWVLNETTCKWEAPVTYPDDGELYRWNEASTNWVLC